MAKCPSCGADLALEARFCEECGASIPQNKVCPKCHAEVKSSAKFCAECGYNFESGGKSHAASAVSIGDKNVIAGDVIGISKKIDVAGDVALSAGSSDDKTGGIAMGDKNVISGDVVGHLESYRISGNATIVKNTDETKKMVKCHVCGRNMTIDESFDCPVCREKTCSDCFSRESGACKTCSTQELQSKENEYKDALSRVYADGHVDLSERRELMALQKRLGLSASRAVELENAVKSCLTNGSSASLSTFEKFSLSKAELELYVNGNPRAAIDLLDAIYKAHPLDESVLATYLAALCLVEKDRARTIISSLQADVLGAYLAEIDMALSENDVNAAEERLLQAELMWPESILLKCRRIKFLHLMYEVASDDSFLAEASNVMVELGDPSSPLEASWIFYAQNLVSGALGEDVPTVTEEHCKNNDLYFPVASGRLFA